MLRVRFFKRGGWRQEKSAERTVPPAVLRPRPLSVRPAGPRRPPGLPRRGGRRGGAGRPGAAPRSPWPPPTRLHTACKQSRRESPGTGGSPSRPAPPPAREPQSRAARPGGGRRRKRRAGGGGSGRRAAREEAEGAAGAAGQDGFPAWRWLTLRRNGAPTRPSSSSPPEPSAGWISAPIPASPSTCCVGQRLRGQFCECSGEGPPQRGCGRGHYPALAPARRGGGGA